MLNKLLQTLQEALNTTPIKCDVFPSITAFDSYFIEKNNELKQKTKKLKVQLKLCPGVEPPQIKKVQIETYKMVKRPYTE